MDNKRKWIGCGGGSGKTLLCRHAGRARLLNRHMKPADLVVDVWTPVGLSLSAWCRIEEPGRRARMCYIPGGIKTLAVQWCDVFFHYFTREENTFVTLCHQCNDSCGADAIYQPLNKRDFDAELTAIFLDGSVVTNAADADKFRNVLSD